MYGQAMSLQVSTKATGNRNYPKCIKCTRRAVHFHKNYQLCEWHKVKMDKLRPGKGTK